MEPEICSVKGCKNSNEKEKDLCFFPFPTRERLRVEWIKFCKDEILLGHPSSHLCRHNFVCALHFEPSCFKSPLQQSLNRGSIPTIYLTHHNLKAILNEPVSPIPSSPPVDADNKEYKLYSDEYHNCDEIFNLGNTPVPSTTVENSKDFEGTSNSFSYLESTRAESPTRRYFHKKVIKRCCVVRCPNSSSNSKNIIYFPFPSPDVEPERFELWLDLSEFTEVIRKDNYRKFFICPLHFEDSHFDSSFKAKLKADAFPTKVAANLDNVFTKGGHLTSIYKPISIQQLKDNNTIQIDNHKAGKDVTYTEKDIFPVVPPTEFAKVENFYDDYFNRKNVDRYYDGCYSDVDCNYSFGDYNFYECSSNLDHYEESNSNSNDIIENENENIEECLQNEKLPVDKSTSTEEDKATDSEDQNLDSGGGDKINYKRYKFVVTIVKDIDERKSIKKLKYMIVKKVRQLVNRLIFETPLRRSRRSSDNNENTSQVTNLIRFDINDDNLSGLTNSLELFDFNKQQIVPAAKWLSTVRDVKLTANRNPPEEECLCNHCGEILRSESHLQHHIKLYHVEQICELCGLRCTNLVELRKHKKKEKRSIKNKLLKEKQIVKRLKHSCDICNVNCRDEYSLTRHKLILHNVGEFVNCDKCDKRFYSRISLDFHKKEKHSNEVTVLVCEHCGKTFATRAILSNHVKSFHEDETKRIYECSICNEPVNSMTTLQLHLTGHMNGTSIEEQEAASELLSRYENVRPCFVCRLKFSGNALEALQQHLEYHEMQDDIKKLKEELAGDHTGPFICRICMGRFPDKNKFAMHRYFIHKVTPFICRKSDCGSTFWSNWELVIHRRSSHLHTNFDCSFCGESFTSYAYKMTHVKSKHPNKKEKPFQCQICNKRFLRSKYLKVHIREVHGTKIQCNVCSKVCVSELAFKRHVRSHNVFIKEPKRERKLKRRASDVDHLSISQSVSKEGIIEMVDDNMDIVLTEDEIAVENIAHQVTVELYIDNTSYENCSKVTL